MGTNHYVAAIGTDGARPVIWGVGDTEDAARIDANRWLPHPQPLIVIEITESIADRCYAGEVACSELGICVRMDRDGEIIDAHTEIGGSS